MDKKIGILTGGGDCGGLNAAIEAIVKSANNEGWEVYGIRKGWEGLISGNLFRLDVSKVDGIHSQTGTVLQTSRTNPYRFTGKLDGKDLQEADVSEAVIRTMENFGLEAVIVAGGDDTLSVIPRLVEGYGTSPTFIGIPKTMDGDLQVYSLGLDTAINRSKKLLEDFVPILKASGSIGIMEFFGRDVGRLTFEGGIAGGADVILIPEIPVDLGYVCNFIADKYDERARRDNGAPYVLVAVAEGTKHPLTGQRVYLDNGEDSFGHSKLGGIGEETGRLIEEYRLKDDPRITKHTTHLDIKQQRPTYDVRGGETLASDSYIGQKRGAAAVRFIREGAESGMAVVDFDEYMPIMELIKPRPVNMTELERFERSGLYCFGRKPYEKADASTPVVNNVETPLL